MRVPSVARDCARSGRFVFRRSVIWLVNFIAMPPDIIWMQAVRRWLIRLVGVRIGAGSQLSESFYIFDGRRFCCGSGTRIGSFCRVWDFHDIRIGRDLLASHGLTLIAGSHNVDSIRSARPGEIVVGDNVWIGINVTIVGPAVIGDNVIIGANSFVTGDLAPNAIYAGSPARFIRSYMNKGQSEASNAGVV
jgi:acetyltransferase-like isoleucine patch superfamily enzyme